MLCHSAEGGNNGIVLLCVLTRQLSVDRREGSVHWQTDEQ